MNNSRRTDLSDISFVAKPSGTAPAQGFVDGERLVYQVK
jgi:hypothetical protein